MKGLILALFLAVFSQAYGASSIAISVGAGGGGGNLTGAPTMIVAGVAVNVLDPNIVILNFEGASGGSHVSGKLADNSFYSPGVGRNLLIMGCEIETTSNNQTVRIGYADTSTTNAAPTNIVWWLNGSSAASDGGIIKATIGTSTTPEFGRTKRNLTLETPTSKFPFILGPSGGEFSGICVGYERDN